MAEDNFALPYKIHHLNAHGRLVRVGGVLDEIITRHDYPPALACLLGQGLVLTALLGSALKFEGRFSIQSNSEGVVSTLICEMRTAGAMRGHIIWDKERLARYGDNPSVKTLLGEGHIAFSIQQDGAKDNYQGVVALEGDLLDAAHHYFARSVQIETRLRLVAEPTPSGWRAGGVMIQQGADEGGQDAPPLAPDDWTRLTTLLETTSDEELLDNNLTASTLLYRLFNEDGVRVFEPRPLHFACPCSRERIANLLASFTPEEREQSIEEGRITVTCEFCNQSYIFTPAQIPLA